MAVDPEIAGLAALPPGGEPPTFTTVLLLLAIALRVLVEVIPR